MARDRSDLLRWGDVLDAIMQYHSEQVVSKYATSEQCKWARSAIEGTLYAVEDVEAAEIVRCHDCVHAIPLERNCELNTNLYMHCTLFRGDETKNVWHKYKKYYRDYSLVEHDDFCSYGEKRAIK